MGEDAQTLHPAVRWVGPMFAVLALLLVPWTVYLGATLPHRKTAQHYDLAWTGFDVGLIAALAWTGFTAMRRSSVLPIAASINAALLVVDAWFDVVTAGRWSDRIIAVGSAALLELPLAGLCVWIARTWSSGRHSSDQGRTARHPTRQWRP